MFKGFYNLASGMLTQSRVLNTVSNNISNVATPGFKRGTMINSTFREALISRTGYYNKGNVPLGSEQSMIRTVSELVTDYSQGAIEGTDRDLDFCITGNGFFTIETQNGVLYTRNGSFSVNDQGQLSLHNVGRVMGVDGPIYLTTDRISVDELGVITDPDGAYLGRIAIADFNDYAQLLQVNEGMYQSVGEPDVINPPGTYIQRQAIEASNVNAANEMMSMMSGQRALQSAAQVLKMYDTMMNKAVNEIARM